MISQLHSVLLLKQSEPRMPFEDFGSILKVQIKIQKRSEVRFMAKMLAGFGRNGCTRIPDIGLAGYVDC